MGEGGRADPDECREPEYLARWRDRVDHLDDPVEMAFVGGACADRFAWVFVAGYQAALRATFRALRPTGWLAFAVSEDRTGRLPGVSLSNGVLQGFKTWIAAVDSVSGLIVKAGRGPQASYVLIDRSNPGLTLTSHPPASFLAELSQGQAHLVDVPVETVQPLDGGAVAGFGIREALCIYMAFCGHVARYAPDTVYGERAVELAELAPDLVSEGMLVGPVRAFDRKIQALLVDIRDADFPRHGAWHTDQRVVAMYSEGLQAR